MSSDPDVVRREYATERGLEGRASIYAAGGAPDTPAALLALVAERVPARILEVGCGPGKLAEQVNGLDCELRAIDISPRMVELARARGVQADVGDVQALPFGDGEFDLVIAAWMLFHVPDLERGLGEIARVLRPGGQLIAVTNGADHLAELWALVGERPIELSFNAENGAAALGSQFEEVSADPIRGTVTLRDREQVRAYVAASVTRSHLAGRVPELTRPLRASTHNCIFTARTPR